MTVASQDAGCCGGKSLDRPARILIGGVGYRNLRDMSVGPLLSDRLQQCSWPEGVEVEDLSYGPIGVMHNLDDRPAYQRLILVAGVKREREPGRVYSYRWKHELPDEEEIQARVSEAITGVISLDNLLIIGSYFRKLPRDVSIIEVEAIDDNWGEELTPAVEDMLPAVIEEIHAKIREPQWA